MQGNFSSVCVCANVHVHTSPHVCGYLQRPEDIMTVPGAGETGDAEHLTGVLETELRSSGRAEGALSPRG